MGSVWIPARDAEVGRVYSAARLRDVLGEYVVEGDRFLHDDGKWYRIDPPLELSGNVIAVLEPKE